MSINLLALEKIIQKERIKLARPEELIKKDKYNSDRLKIAYIMAWTGICGGSKIILEHANLLTERGHEIFLVSHDKKPTWFELNKEVDFIEVPLGKIVCEYIPKDVDVIVCTFSSYIYEAIEQRIAPVVYFEQGEDYLFVPQKIDKEKFEFVSKEYELCNNIITVSNYAKERIKNIFGKEAVVIPNAVDDKIFFCNKIKSKSDVINITTIGRENWEFKGIKFILEAVKELYKEYKINFNWITQIEPKTKIGNIIVNPPQIEIGNILRNTDIYISSSYYESFGLPILEAMSCGATVITTDTGGNREFAINNETCLNIDKANPEDLVKKVRILIENEELRKKLAQNALTKVKQYNWKDVVNKLEIYYKEIVQYTVK